jgi:hypothetical protein
MGSRPDLIPSGQTFSARRPCDGVMTAADRYGVAVTVNSFAIAVGPIDNRLQSF